MNLYHFAFSYKGGDYNSQYSAKCLDDAITVWSKTELDSISHMSDKHKKCVVTEVADGIETPTALSTLKNVWHMSFYSGHTRMQLLIVKVSGD